MSESKAPVMSSRLKGMKFMKKTVSQSEPVNKSEDSKDSQAPAKSASVTNAPVPILNREDQIATHWIPKTKPTRSLCGRRSFMGYNPSLELRTKPSHNSTPKKPTEPEDEDTEMLAETSVYIGRLGKKRGRTQGSFGESKSRTQSNGKKFKKPVIE